MAFAGLVEGINIAMLKNASRPAVAVNRRRKKTK
jgi:hypothetical protein